MGGFGLPFFVNSFVSCVFCSTFSYLIFINDEQIKDRPFCSVRATFSSDF